MNLHADMAKKNHIGNANENRGNPNQQIGATHFSRCRQGVYVADVSSVSQTVMLLIRGALGICGISLEASS
jgi:hypothetical protein